MACVSVSLGAGWEVLWVSGQDDWVWALPILEEHGESGICFGCSGVGGVEGVCGRLGPGFGRVGWCYVCVCCVSGCLVFMAGLGICILC